MNTRNKYDFFSEIMFKPKNVDKTLSVNIHVKQMTNLFACRDFLCPRNIAFEPRSSGSAWIDTTPLCAQRMRDSVAIYHTHRKILCACSIQHIRVLNPQILPNNSYRYPLSTSNILNGPQKRPENRTKTAAF